MLARDPGWAVLGRPARYAVLSLLAGGLAQGGLALAYGLLGWGTAAATLLSLAVSIGPPTGAAGPTSGRVGGVDSVDGRPPSSRPWRWRAA
jgi:hypothetical protein